MAPRVTMRVRPVWRAAGRTFLRPSAAYYALAKRLVLAKYPPDDKQATDEEQAEASGVAIDVWLARRVRREALFHRAAVHGEHPEDYWEGFDVKRYQRFVKRLARFLRFVDERRAALEGGPDV